MGIYYVLEVRDADDGLASSLRTSIAIGALALYVVLSRSASRDNCEVVMVTVPYGNPDDGMERMLTWDEIAVISGYVRGCAA